LTRPDEPTRRHPRLKAWKSCPDFLGDIAVTCMKPDHGKRIAHHLQPLSRCQLTGPEANEPREVLQS
jgi:hypothetical protein